MSVRRRRPIVSSNWCLLLLPQPLLHCTQVRLTFCIANKIHSLENEFKNNPNCCSSSTSSSSRVIIIVVDHLRQIFMLGGASSNLAFESRTRGAGGEREEGGTSPAYKKNKSSLLPVFLHGDQRGNKKNGQPLATMYIVGSKSSSSFADHG